MTRAHGNILIRLFAAACGLVVAVMMTGCGETGDLGQDGEETTSAATEEGGETEEPRSPTADETETPTSDSDDEGEPTEETTSEPADEGGGGGGETEEPTQDFADESEETEEPTSENPESGGDGSEAEASSESFSGSGMTTTETVHLEGDYTVAFSVTGNALMDMESNFIADLVNVDEELDFHILVNEIGTEASGTTNVYGLDGDYYLDVMAEGDWSFEFTPQ